MSPALAGRAALVTGAASGIGLAIGRAFLAAGARVAVADRDGDGLTAAFGSDAGCIRLVGDLTRAKDAAQVVAAAADGLGALDTIVNVVGAVVPRPFPEISDEDWQGALDVNLNSSFYVARAAVPLLRRTDGGQCAIVNISSGAGLRPMKGRAAYCTAKAGLVMMGKVMALDLAEMGIRVNTIAPGLVETPAVHALLAGHPAPQEVLARRAAEYALGRLGQPHEIAAAAVFLASDAASFMTGACLSVDGGKAFH